MTYANVALVSEMDARNSLLLKPHLNTRNKQHKEVVHINISDGYNWNFIFQLKNPRHGMSGFVDSGLVYYQTEVLYYVVIIKRQLILPCH